MTHKKDEALDLALEALERMKGYGNVFLHRRDERNPHEQVCEAITAINQALAAPVQEPEHIVNSNGRYSPLLTRMMNKRVESNVKQVIHLYDEPPAQPAPAPKGWPSDDLVTEKAKQSGFDLSQMPNMLYAVRGNHAQLVNFAKAMIATLPAAQHQCKWPTCQSEEYQQALAEQINQELVTGAAQRQWVGLTDDERAAIGREMAKTLPNRWIDFDYARAVEAKLKEKNGITEQKGGAA
jgi:hypothetical protein